MKAIKTTYIVVIENEKKQNLLAPLVISFVKLGLPDKVDYEFWKLASHLVDSCTQTKS